MFHTKQSLENWLILIIITESPRQQNHLLENSMGCLIQKSNIIELWIRKAPVCLFRFANTALLHCHVWSKRVKFVHPSSTEVSSLLRTLVKTILFNGVFSLNCRLLFVILLYCSFHLLHFKIVFYASGFYYLCLCGFVILLLCLKCSL